MGRREVAIGRWEGHRSSAGAGELRCNGLFGGIGCVIDELGRR